MRRGRPKVSTPNAESVPDEEAAEAMRDGALRLFGRAATIGADEFIASTSIVRLSAVRV